MDYQSIPIPFDLKIEELRITYILKRIFTPFKQFKKSENTHYYLDRY